MEAGEDEWMLQLAEAKANTAESVSNSRSYVGVTISPEGEIRNHQAFDSILDRLAMIASLRLLAKDLETQVETLYDSEEEDEDDDIIS